LSSPPNQASGHCGRSDRIIAALMQTIARLPVTCTIGSRMPKKLDASKTEVSASSHKSNGTTSVAQNTRFSLCIGHSSRASSDESRPTNT